MDNYCKTTCFLTIAVYYVDHGKSVNELTWDTYFLQESSAIGGTPTKRQVPETKTDVTEKATMYACKILTMAKDKFVSPKIIIFPENKGHIVADTNVSPFARACNICCGHRKCF